MMDFLLPEAQQKYEQALAQLEERSIIKRIWEHDHTVWDPDPAEITNRLGWLDISEVMKGSLSRMYAFRDSLRNDGYQRVVLLGMGGSSLAPDVFRRTFGVRDGFPVLEVLDTTHPNAIHAVSSNLDYQKTAFIVATKSGTTVETLSLFRYFYNRLGSVVSEDEIGEHFIAITDPGSPLVGIAETHNFREIFINDPDIGGRYSALSFFGLVPAAIIGVDLERLLEEASRARSSSRLDSEPGENHAAQLGTILGVCEKMGRDKLTFLMSEKVAPLGDWVEQLIAESTGKKGKGILPVVGEPIGEPGVYGPDRIFIHVRWWDDPSLDSFVSSLTAAGHPVVRFEVEDLASLGGLFYLWEMATAVAGFWLGINPFDQPNVESAKNRAKEMVAAYREQGELPAEDAAFVSEHLALYYDAPGGSERDGANGGDDLASVLRTFIRSGAEDGYLSIQAYLPPSAEVTRQLRDIQGRVRDGTGAATTVGYGPRFLHSTGQLHKGDAGKGLFLQLTDEKKASLEIPDKAGSPSSSITFNTLIDAQAMGDRRALVDAGRSVIRIHIMDDLFSAFDTIREAI
ncbi:MAG: hypothetical protein P1P76_07055 [Anaerolineales bacterium]|nr:hypothetical protein [Anaerolineales bacterium]